MTSIDQVRKPLLAEPPDFAAARKLLPEAKASVTRLTSLVLDPGEDRLIEGCLVVEGPVVLGENAGLWVWGDCEIGGAVYSEGFDYSLLCVGGRLKAKHIHTGGEIFAMGGLRAGTLWGRYNDHSTYAPEAVCDLYIAEDREDILPRLRAKKRVECHSVGAATLKKLFKGLRKATPAGFLAYFVGKVSERPPEGYDVSALRDELRQAMALKERIPKVKALRAVYAKIRSARVRELAKEVADILRVKDKDRDSWSCQDELELLGLLGAGKEIAALGRDKLKMIQNAQSFVAAALKKAGWKVKETYPVDRWVVDARPAAGAPWERIV